jgi:hypothetical protein
MRPWSLGQHRYQRQWQEIALPFCHCGSFAQHGLNEKEVNSGMEL